MTTTENLDAVEKYREAIRGIIETRARSYILQKQFEQIMRDRFGIGTLGECRDLDGCWGDPTLVHVDH